MPELISRCSYRARAAAEQDNPQPDKPNNLTQPEGSGHKAGQPRDNGDYTHGANQQAKEIQSLGKPASPEGGNADKQSQEATQDFAIGVAQPVCH